MSALVTRQVWIWVSCGSPVGPVRMEALACREGYLIGDSTIIRAHQHAAGAKKGGLKIRPLAAPAVA